MIPPPVPCSSCGALPLEPCVTLARKRAKEPHSARIIANVRRSTRLAAAGIGDLDRRRVRNDLVARAQAAVR